MAPPPAVLLDVQHLTTVFQVKNRHLRAVDDVSFQVRAGETLALVGESGCGKSATAHSLMRLGQPPGLIEGGRIGFEGRDLLALPERAMRELRGARISLVFQEPATALNPVFTIGDQLTEAMRVHSVPAREARERTLELLAAVKIPDPPRCARDYPHQLSGGMRQRALIAMALACRPSLLIADEPTTALDVTIQAQILDLLREMREAFHLALLLITHDLGIVAGMADRVAVMYAGRIVEQADVRDLFGAPAHPYTRGLLRSLERGVNARRLQAIEGNVPRLDELPAGCAFAPRCPERQARCEAAPPASTTVAPGHDVRCVLR
jgi:peptide/nickel transport system ATP-binding protein